MGLNDLLGWRFNVDGPFVLEGNSMRIRQIRVAVKGREVPTWDQPIIDCGREGYVLLACGRIDGVLHFLFRPQAEAGLPERVELTATVVVEPGEDAHEGTAPSWRGTVVAECHQSEEGGRFFQDTNHYRIMDIGDVARTDGQGYWLTLGDIRRLLDEPGWLTNEARSALSLLLPWM
jgi:oxidase EvaA